MHNSNITMQLYPVLCQKFSWTFNFHFLNVYLPHIPQLIPHVLMVSCLVMSFNMACNYLIFLCHDPNSAQYNIYHYYRAHLHTSQSAWGCLGQENCLVLIIHQWGTGHSHHMSTFSLMTCSWPTLPGFDLWNRLLSSLDSDLYKSCAVNKLCVIIPHHLQMRWAGTCDIIHHEWSQLITK